MVIIQKARKTQLPGLFKNSVSFIRMQTYSADLLMQNFKLQFLFIKNFKTYLYNLLKRPCLNAFITI